MDGLPIKTANIDSTIKRSNRTIVKGAGAWFDNGAVAFGGGGDYVVEYRDEGFDRIVAPVKNGQISSIQQHGQRSSVRTHVTYFR